MGSFGKSQGGGRRKAPRSPAPLLAVLSTVTADHRAALVNVSRTGARFSGLDLPREGEELMLRAGHVQSFGRIIWSAAGQCGVAFETPLALEEVERLRVHADEWIFAGLSAEESAAAEQWELGISR